MFIKKKKLVEKSSQDNNFAEELEQIRLKYETSQNSIEDTLMSINELLQFMTQLDYVKDMLVDVETQASMIENVAASSQEMTASVSDVSAFVVNSKENTEKALNLTNESINIINTSFTKIDEAFVKTKETQSIMHKVNDEAKKISELVEVIKNVSEQTNLLALNASIEAARAGDTGKGFAVVADEIKKLADNTKQQVTDIQSLVSALQLEVIKSTNSIDDASDTFEEGKEHINKAITSIDSMEKALKTIGDDFTEITANIEEQTAASEEIASTLMEINQKIQVVKTETNKTGEAFYKISKILDQLRLKILNNSKNLSIKNQLELCISDHLMWKWRVYNMLLGYETLRSENVGTHNDCRLGKWVNSVGSEIEKYKSILIEMEEPHAALHEQATRAIEYYNKGDLYNAEKLLEEMEHSSSKVVTHLNKLKNLS